MSKPKASRERCWNAGDFEQWSHGVSDKAEQAGTVEETFSLGSIHLGSLGLLSHLRKFRFSDETFLFVKRHRAGIVEWISSKRLHATSGLLFCGLCNDLDALHADNIADAKPHVGPQAHFT